MSAEAGEKSNAANDPDGEDPQLDDLINDQQKKVQLLETPLLDDELGIEARRSEMRARLTLNLEIREKNRYSVLQRKRVAVAISEASLQHLDDANSATAQVTKRAAGGKTTIRSPNAKKGKSRRRSFYETNYNYSEDEESETGESEFDIADEDIPEIISENIGSGHKDPVRQTEVAPQSTEQLYATPARVIGHAEDQSRHQRPNIRTNKQVTEATLVRKAEHEQLMELLRNMHQYCMETGGLAQVAKVEKQIALQHIQFNRIHKE